MIFPTINLEKSLWQKGFANVAGLDEAGRGPLAGPVVAGAVMIHKQDQIVVEVRDSKKMSEKKREAAYTDIIAKSTGWGVGVVDAEQIDRIGIQKAVLKAMKMALGNLVSSCKLNPEYLIVDGKGVLMIPGYKMEKITKGDLNHYSIAAASILAKVTRDRIMKDLADKYPQYGFAKHVGYGTKAHIDAIYSNGPCEIHRKTFKPISELV